MLKQLRRELPKGCISDLSFDQWRAAELEPAEVALLEAHISQCQQCRERRRTLDGHAEQFLAEFPDPKLTPSQESKKLPTAQPATVVVLASRRRLFGVVSALAGVAAAAAFALVLRPTDEGQLTTRTKGSDRLGFYVKSARGVAPGMDGDRVHPGDQLRFTVTTSEPRHVAILSLDGAGVASVYFSEGPRSHAVGSVHELALEHGIQLDDSLGQERLFGVFCPRAFAVEPLRVALERQGKLPALDGCSVDRLTLTKEPAP